MAEFHVHVTTDARIDPSPSNEAQWDDLMDALAPLHASLATDREQRFTVQTAVTAGTLHTAVQRAARAVLDALTGVGVTDTTVVAVEAMTADEFAARLHGPVDLADLIPTIEVAAFLGVGKQRVRQLVAEHDSFPRPVEVPGSRSMQFPRRQVEAFAATWDRRPGPKRRADEQPAEQPTAKGA